MDALQLILLACLAVMGLCLFIQTAAPSDARPCLFYFGGLFFVLFLLVPFLMNLLFGNPPRIDWLAGQRITRDYAFHIYGAFIAVTTALYSGLCYLTIRSAALTGARPVKSAPAPAESTFDERRLLMWLAAAVLAGLVAFIYGTGMSLAEIFVASRFEWVGQDLGNPKIVLLSNYMLSLVALYSYFDVRQSFPRKWLSIIVYSGVIAFVILSGGRKWVFFVLSGLIGGYYSSRQRVIGGRVLLGVAVFVVFGIVWQYVRSLGIATLGQQSGFFGGMADSLPRLLAEGDISYFYRASLEAITLHVERGILYPMAVLSRLVFLVVPDQLTFGLKAASIPWMFAADFGAGTEFRAGNLPPGLVGLFVLSFGWLVAILLGPIMTLAMVWFGDKAVMWRDSYLSHLVLANFCIIALLFMRGTTGGFYFLVFQLVVLFGLRFVNGSTHVLTYRESV